jgi:hypothetical protein
VATFLATPSSANLAAALTDETGSGAAVFATSPTLTTPTLGTANATSIVFTNAQLKTGGTNALAARLSNDSDYAVFIGSKFRASDVSGNIQVGLSQSNAGQIELISGGRLDFAASATQANTTKDTGLRRNAAGVLEVYDGITGGTYRDLRLRNLITATSVTWSSGAGSPEGVVTAAVGSLYTRTDGGAGTTLYVKESGAGNTGWVAK